MLLQSNIRITILPGTNNMLCWASNPLAPLRELNKLAPFGQSVQAWLVHIYSTLLFCINAEEAYIVLIFLCDGSEVTAPYI